MKNDCQPPEGSPEELDLLRCLQRVHTYSFKTKADYSREYATEIAEGASRGFLTTRVIASENRYGHHWKLTLLGLAHLTQWAHLIGQEEVSNYDQGQQED